MNTLDETNPPVKFVNKEAMVRILDEIDKKLGFIHDPTATAESARAMMLADGVRPEDNSASREIIAMREEKIQLCLGKYQRNETAVGYVIHSMEESFYIRKENVEAAFEAVYYLPSQEEHLWWVKIDDAEAAHDLGDLLSAWRWCIDEDEEGNITDLFFTGEKYGKEDLLFATLAPFVEDGSFIQMMGEDGVIWRWHFTDGTVQKQYGRVVFDEEALNVVRSRYERGELEWPHAAEHNRNKTV